MAGELILIIEDNEKNLKLVRDVLQFKGYRTVEAGSAEADLELAQRQRPDLVLMDIQLPGMDGVAALLALKANPHTALLKVVALTAFALREEEARIRAAGFHGDLSKPLDIRQFPAQGRQFCDTP